MTPLSHPGNGPKGRFLSKEECSELAQRVRNFAVGGGGTEIQVESVWSGNIRWARNQITTTGDLRNNDVGIIRIVRGAGSLARTNQIDDKHLEATVRRAERLLQQQNETAGREYSPAYLEPFKEPVLWFDRTYQLEAAERAEIMRKLVKPAEEAGMVAAGYIQVSAHGRAVLKQGDKELYFPFTRAQYSVTVRDPKGLGSGWAGVDWNDWQRIDSEKISTTALDKCLRSRNPVAVEPGRYTTILEPQAVADFVEPVIRSLDRDNAERDPQNHPFNLRPAYSKIGLQVVDERITISTDPMDPDIGYPPYSSSGSVFNPVTWIEKGVLKELAYARDPYGIQLMGVNHGLPNPNAYRMSGGTATIESMIANTKRGILVTRFSNLRVLHPKSMLMTGVTRDGLWLIENGKISKAIKNFRFTESPLVALNNVVDLGIPQRVFSPGTPTVVPALLVNDFSFTALTDAI